MRKLALAVLTLGLLCWRPSPAATQTLPQANTLQAANLQDRRDDDDRRRDNDDRRRDNDQDRRDADRRDHDRRDNDADRDHYRDRSGRGRYPRGSYVRTCRDIRMEGSTLRASCQKNDSRWRDTSLKHGDACQGQVINDNGRLRCM